MAAAALTAYVLGRALRHSGSLLSYHWHVNGWLAAVSIAGVVVHFTVSGVLWTRTLQLLGYPLPARTGIRIWALSQLGRYVPGTVWMAAGRAYLAGQESVPAGITVLSMLLEAMLVVGTGATVGGGLAFLTRDHARYPFAAACLVGGIALLVFCHPRLVRVATRVAGRVAPRRLATLVDASPVRYPWDVALGYVAIWGCFGLWFACFVWALVSVPASSLPQLAYAMLASWLLGFVAVLTPSGLGVREASLALLVQPVLGTEVAAAVALAARVWLTLGELLFIGGAVALAHGARRGRRR